MTTREIADRLVELIRKGDYKTCYEELYSPEIQSIEPDGRVYSGFGEIQQKGKEWNESIEDFHGSECGDAIVSGNHFSLPMNMTVTFKGAPGPTKFEEICVYEVKEGKVVKEQFFYEQQNAPQL